MFDHNLKRNSRIGKTKTKIRKQNETNTKIGKNKSISKISKTKQCLRSENKAPKRQRQRRSAKHNNVKDQLNKTTSENSKTKQRPRSANQNNIQDQNITRLSKISKTKQCPRSAKQNTQKRSPTLQQHWILATCTPCNTPPPPAKYIISCNNDNGLEITKYIRYMIMIYNSCM